MRVSIIIPAYNAERFLEATVNSVLAQTHGDWDLTIVDNASTDGTALIASHFATQDKRIRVETLAQNQGPSGARNFGLFQSPLSDAVAFLDADDLWFANTLALLSAALLSDATAVASHGKVTLIDAEGGRIQGREVASHQTRWRAQRFGRASKLSDHEPTSLGSIATWCISTPGAVLVRRAEVDALGGFDPSFPICADWDYWLRLAARGTFRYTPEPVLAYRRHPWAMSNTHSTLQKDVARCFEKNFNGPTLADAQKRTIQSGYRSYNVLLARSKLRYLQESARHWRLSDAARQLKYAGAHLIRAARGCANQHESG